MTDETRKPSVDFDLDEDLFGFGESSLIDTFDDPDDVDLDEIFAAFQESPAASLLDDPLETPGDPDVPDMEAVPAPGPAARPSGRAKPELHDVWTPQSAITPRLETAGNSVRGDAPVVVSAGLSKSALWLLVAITSINALVAVVTLQGTSAMRDSVLDVGRHVTATADEIRTGAYEQARVLNDLQTPIVPSDAEEHPTFDRARDEIAKGQYGSARQRLYALLSIVDRLDPEQRQTIEARAQFLLAEALHLEALERMEVEQ